MVEIGGASLLKDVPIGSERRASLPASGFMPV
jgi:hypothetical protein